MEIFGGGWSKSLLFYFVFVKVGEVVEREGNKRVEDLGLVEVVQVVGLFDATFLLNALVTSFGAGRDVFWRFACDLVSGHSLC